VRTLFSKTPIGVLPYALYGFLQESVLENGWILGPDRSVYSSPQSSQLELLFCEFLVKASSRFRLESSFHLYFLLKIFRKLIPQTDAQRGE